MRLIRILKYDLCREVAAWVGEEIITTNQAESICSRYGVDFNNMSRRSYGYRVLVGFGCLFIGLALISLIGANWDEIPRAIRMSGLIALTLGAHLLGLVYFRQDQTNRAIAFFFLGSLFYGASIMLIAQIYHIGEHYPDGIFWWAIGVLPVGILMESTMIMMLAVCLGFIWFFVESSMNFYPALFPVFLIALFWHLRRGRQSNISFLVLVAGLGTWAEYTLAWLMSDEAGFRPGAENVVFAVGLFAIFHGLSKWLEKSQHTVIGDYGTLLGLWTLRFTIITMFVFSFEEPWRELIEAQWHIPGIAITISFLCTAAAIWLSYRSRKSIISTVAFALMLNIGLIAVLLSDNRENALVFQFADNILLVSIGIGLIIQGIQNHISHYFYAGVFSILATGLLRYIDLIGNYVGASILFAILAAVLLLVAKYWKNHQAKTRGAS